MSNSGEPNFPAEYSVSGVVDTRAPMMNLSAIRVRMDTLQRFLSDSVNSNTLIGKDRMAMVSTQIESAIYQIIVNGSALLACSRKTNPPESNRPVAGEVTEPPDLRILKKNEIKRVGDLKVEVSVEEEVKLKFEEDVCEIDCEIVELDAMELLAEHIHFCDVCGKGFKRDANLRMHMRAHGNQFKTPEALAKPDRGAAAELGRKVRFSCPFDGCKRNKKHKKFRALKSVICVKNHFKRSHCPKMFSCNRCHKKSFSVVADLKSHLKHCGESKWLCSCGTSFSRKDKLFGHMALFEGHMPAVVDEDEKAKVVPAMEEDGDDKAKIVSAVEEDEDEDMGVNGLDNGIFEGLLDGFGSIENYCLQDMLGSPNCLVTGMEEFRDILQ